MKKEELLENIRDYSPKEIVSAIRSGVVTFYELKTGTHGQFSPLMQRRVQEMLNSGDVPDAEAPANATPATPSTPKAEEKKESPRAQSNSFQNTEKKKSVSTSSNDATLLESVSTSSDDATLLESVSTSGDDATLLEVDSENVLPLSEPSIDETPTTFCFPEDEPVSSRKQPFICQICGNPLPPNATICPFCVASTDGSATDEITWGVPPPPSTPPPPINRGFTEKNDTPSNLYSFSWGGFLMGWLWGVCNGVYWSLLSLIILIIGGFFAQMFISTNDSEGVAFILIITGAVEFLIRIILGVSGNKFAWKSKDFGSAKRFEEVQRTWRNVALAILGVFLGLGILLLTQLML